MLAFGSPWDMGYFHHATAHFAKVHNRQNPLGLRMPDPTLVGSPALGRASRPALLCPDPCPGFPRLVGACGAAGASTWLPCSLAIVAPSSS